MPGPLPPTIRLADMDAARRLALPTRAAAQVDQGHPIAGPTNLGYALLTPAPTPNPAAPSAAHPSHAPALVCPDLDALLRIAPGLTPIQQRVLRRLDPGLILIRVGFPPDSAPKMLQDARLAAGVCDDGRFLRVRLADQGPLGRIGALLTRPGVLTPLLDPAGRPVADAAAARQSLDAASLTGVQLIDAGEPPGSSVRHAPTVIDLPGAGGVHVAAEGAYARRFIMSQAGLTILFVCTGNTCRSPMAEAIAAGLLAKREPGVPVRVLSAGVGASSGAPTTPEALAALRELGFAPPRHASRPLDRALLDQADIVYTMTRSHLMGVLSLDPSARAATLDPAGTDVPDPIGAGPSVYLATARRLQDLIESRLKELAP